MRRKVGLGAALALIAVFAFVHPALGIGISHDDIPRPIVYVPGETYTFRFSASDYGYDVILSVDGDWAEYATMSEITMPSPGVKEFSVTIDPPDSPDTPGIHMVYVGAMEKKPPGAGVGAIAKVQKAILFKVLFPHKSLSAQLVASDANAGEASLMQVSVTSETLQTLRAVRALVEVQDLSGNSVGSAQTETVSLQLGETRVLTAPFSTTGLRPATYVARATVSYDENVTSAEDSFRVGTLQVAILNVTKNITAGAIAPFSIEIESGWNDPIHSLYGELFLLGAQAMKTPTLDTLSPFGKASLNGYVDATALQPGEYDATVVVHFGENSTAVNSHLEVLAPSRPSAAAGVSTAAVFGAIAVVVIVILAYLLLNRRKGGKR